MKKTVIILLAIIATFAVAQADELLRFNQTHYEGWAYTRPDAVLNTDLISHNRVYLYKDGELDYTLVSPVFNRGEAGAIVVNVVGYATMHNTPQYNLNNGSPYVELLYENGDVLQSVQYKFEGDSLERNFTVKFNLGNLEEQNLKLRLACWDATDQYSSLSIRKVFVNTAEPSADLTGDVNGDGSVNAADVTALYNYILNGDETYIATSDVNNDGAVNAGDVTAVYNIILGGILE